MSLPPIPAVADSDWVDFLQSYLPRLGLRWKGFRRVRRQVCRRVQRRMQELWLPDIGAYRERLDADPEECHRLADLCRVTISRFFRDQGAFEHLRRVVLPTHRTVEGLRAWSIGCASGEEPYSVSILWRVTGDRRNAALPLEIVATAVDETALQRARRRLYGPSSLREVPASWLPHVFEPVGEEFRLIPAFAEGVTFERQDVRREEPPGTFGLILCRNLVLTYFDERLQDQVLARLCEHLDPGGFLVIGAHESLPAAWRQRLAGSGPGVFQKTLRRF
jgi:chemotaxis protein methyltransferase CheR